MSYKKIIKLIKPRTYVIPIIISVILFLSSGYFLTNMIHTYFLNEMEKDSNNLARQYTSRLANASVASNTINELIDEKIIVVGKGVVRNQTRVNNDFLEEFSKDLEVDKIYWYNPQGEVIYSIGGEDLGWKAAEGHPVDNFKKSGNSSLVEDIRKESESDSFYKFGYFKAENGYFVQVGVLADRIHDLTNRFSIQSFLDIFNEDENLIGIYFIDHTLNTVASSDRTKIGTNLLDESETDAIIRNSNYSAESFYEGMKIYKTLSPIYVDDMKIGTLAVLHSLENTETLMKRVSLTGLFFLVTLFLIIGAMVNSIYKKSNKLEYLAYYDSLTSLPNREHLTELLKDEMEKNKEGNKALLLVSSNNFKIINLTFGHEKSDEIMIELANKLKPLNFDKTILFRYSADRFVFYVDEYRDQQQLVDFSIRILALFDSPFQTTDVSNYITAKIGIVEINENHKNVNSLLKDLEIAVSTVKENGQKSYSFFNESMKGNLLRDETIEKVLRQAIYNNDKQELYLEYQPQIDLKTNRIIGFEALARMRNEELGSVSPIEFIDLAEKRKLIIPLGELILKTACKFINTLENEGFNEIKVAINISVIQLLQDDFVSDVMKIINEIGINEENLELEITETILMDDYENINDKLLSLKKQGIKIALDDFGTGYSSLARIGELKIDCLKIDKYFIDKLLNKNREEALVGAIISLAHRLGLTVVAEGVEVEEQKEYLLENGCDVIQGYLFSKPVSKDNGIKLLKEGRTKGK